MKLKAHLIQIRFNLIESYISPLNDNRISFNIIPKKPYEGGIYFSTTVKTIKALNTNDVHKSVSSEISPLTSIDYTINVGLHE